MTLLLVVWISLSRCAALSTPLYFERNQGQTDARTQFVARGAGVDVGIASGGVVLHGSMRLRLDGARTVRAEAERQGGVVNYLIGNDPAQWRTGVPTYRKLRYRDVYRGVDLVFYGTGQELEYDFVVAAGAAPEQIRWRVEGADAHVDASGNLMLRSRDAAATFRKPVVYQEGRRVEGSFAVAGAEVRFRIGEYDHSKALVIDPVLSYATYLGGSGTDTIGTALGPGNLLVGAAQAIAVDGAGNVYVTGSTFSADFPLKGAYQGAAPGKLGNPPPGLIATAFVTKLSADGSSLVYSTYLGGNGADRGYAIAVDGNGSAYVTGLTSSVNFPVTAGAYQTVCAPAPTNQPPPYTAACNSSNSSAFVAKLNATGSGLVYATFLGGYGPAYATAIAVDGAGRAYVAGTESTICSQTTFPACFPTTGGALIGGDKPTGRQSQFAFAAVFDAAGAKLLYSTLIGGTEFACLNGCGDAYATGITVDGGGAFYVIGVTASSKLPTTAGVVQPSAGPVQGSGSGLQATRGYLMKFNAVAAGASLAYATYLGGSAASVSDYLSGVAVDGSGNVYVAGYTNSKDFPVTAGVYGAACGNSASCSALHVTKLNAGATAILWSTYVGNAKADGSDAVTYVGPLQLDGSGNVYVVGQIAGPGFPMVNAVEPVPSGGSADVLVAELDASGSRLLFSTHLGSKGLNTASPAGLAVDAAGNIYVAGNTSGPDLITTAGAFQTASSDGACCQKGNGFVVKIAPSPTPVLTAGTLGNGATYLEGGLVPGSWAQVKGSNLASTTRIWGASDFTGAGGVLPVTLSGTEVKVNGLAAAVYFVSPGQVSFQVPAGIAGTASVQVLVNGVASNAVTAAAVAHAPGIFPVAINGTNYAAAVFPDGKIAAPPSIGAAFRNAAPGDVVQLFATGLTASPAGTAVPTTLLTGVTVTIGSVTFPAAAAALVAPGEFQVNFAIPLEFAGLPAGLYPISLALEGVASPGTIGSSPAGPVVIPISR